MQKRGDIKSSPANSIDNLAKNLAKTKQQQQQQQLQNKSSKLMSSMNEECFDASTNQQNGAMKQHHIGSPSSPSSSSSSSISSVSSVSSINPGSAVHANALAAAVAAINKTPGPSQKDLAKLNSEVKNFKLQDQVSPSSQFLPQQYNLNNLLAAAANAGSGLQSNMPGLDPNILNLLNAAAASANIKVDPKKQQQMQQKLPVQMANKQRNQQQQNSAANTPRRTYNKSAKQLDANDIDTGSLNYETNDVVAAAMMAASAAFQNPSSIQNSSFNNLLAAAQQQQQSKKQQIKRNDLIKGNSMSPSPHGSCSEETETLSSGSPPPMIKSESVNGCGSSISSVSSGSYSSSSSSSGSLDQRRRARNIPIKKENGQFEEDNDCENDCDDIDEDSRSLPHSNSPRSASNLAHNDLQQSTNNQDYDTSLMDNQDDEDDLENTNRGVDDEDLDETNMNSNLDDDEHDDQNDDENASRRSSLAGSNQGKIKMQMKKSQNQARKQQRNDSTSSPTRSSSSPNQSRSVSPVSSSTYHDSPAAFPNLAAVAAAAGGLDPTALMAAQSLLPGAFNTPNGANGAAASSQQGDLTNSFNLISDAASTAALVSTTASVLDQTNSVANLIASTRKRRNDRESMSERIKKIKPVPDDKKDDAYWERRRKNNEAAKRSRDLRRQKEDEIAVRASFLEQENVKLRAQITILKTEMSKLHFMLYNR